MTDAMELAPPAGWRPSAEKPVPVVQCTVIKRDGNRCRRWSLRGTTVCIKHGGRLPHVQEHARAVVEAARMRLFDMGDLAADTFEALMEPGTAEGIRLKAASEVFDRIGIRGGADNTLSVEVTHREDPAAILRDRLASIAKRAEESAPYDIIEGEIVPDTDENQPTLFEI